MVQSGQPRGEAIGEQGLEPRLNIFTGVTATWWVIVAGPAAIELSFQRRGQGRGQRRSPGALRQL